MFKSVPLFVGLRYIRVKRRNRFTSVSVFSTISIALGVMVLIVVVSIMNGFETEIKNRLLNMESHITLHDFAKPWQQTIAQAKQNPNVVGAAPLVDGFGLINRGNDSNGVHIRGIDPKLETNVSNINKHMYSGDLQNLQKTPFAIILGYEIAYNLLGPYEMDRLKAGRSISDDKVMLVVPKLQIGPAGVYPRYKRFKIVGVFRLNMKEYDSNTVLINIKDAAKLFKNKNQVSAIQLKLSDLYKADQVKSQLKHHKVANQVSVWSERHKELFSAMATEKQVMFLILFILILVAVINIVSTLVMVVSEKKADIAIMRTIGAGPGMIRNIFIVQGTVIGMLGVLIGVVVGVFISVKVEANIKGFEWMFDMEVMSSKIYYINKIVGEVHWQEIAVIAVSTFLVTVIATLYPAYKAARTDPAQALRYE